MLWTALMVLVIFLLMGFSILFGWLLIRLLLVVGFGGADHLAVERATGVELKEVARLSS